MISEESERFYKGCLQIAKTYGNTRDMASVNIAFGSLYTNVRVSITIIVLMLQTLFKRKRKSISDSKIITKKYLIDKIIILNRLVYKKPKVTNRPGIIVIIAMHL